MKIGLHIYLLMLAFFASPLALKADDDIHIKICNDTKYINCMGTNSKDCIAAHIKAKKYCEAKFPYMPGSNKEELWATAKKNGNCTIENYISNLGLDVAEFEQCAIFLEPIFNAMNNDALKKSKELDKKFFEEDDPLHNYSN